MTLKCTTSNVSFTGSIKLETYSYGATVIARGNEIGNQDIYMACNHFNLASNNYCMYLSTDGTTGIRSTDVTVNDIKNYPNANWSSSAITFTVPKNEFCEKAFLVQIDSNTYAVCELSCQMTNYNNKRDVIFYSIIYTNGAQSTHSTAWQELELGDGGMHVDWTETGNLFDKIVVCIVFAYKIQFLRISSARVFTCAIGKFMASAICSMLPKFIFSSRFAVSIAFC